MKDIAIYGAGGFGRETAWLIRCINDVKSQWNLIGFFDDGLSAGLTIDGVKVLGGISALNTYKGKLSLVVAIADPAVRRAIIEKFNPHDFDFPTLVHPHADVGSPVNTIGKGCVVTRGVIMTTGVHISDFVIVNLQCTIGHDVVVGKYTTIMPGCSISGNVKIGTTTLIGTGARILQSLAIGDSCKVGAGAVVTKNIVDGVTSFGVPAREK